MTAIIKGLPMPPMPYVRDLKPYPWNDMEIGDAFKFRTNDLSNCKAMCLRHSCNGKVFEYRRTSSTEVFCWRTA